MDAFIGGKLPVVTLNSQNLSSAATTAISNAAGQTLFQGFGNNSFVATTGQAIASNLTGALINVALNPGLGQTISGTSGIDLFNGDQLLATAITPFVSSQLAGLANQQIQQSLTDAGPFAQNLFNQISPFTNSLLTQAIPGATPQGASDQRNGPSRSWPGAGDEPDADYQGYVWNLGGGGPDVVFSIQPANQGPQQFGDAVNNNDPKIATTNVWDTNISEVPSYQGVTYDAETLKKFSDMGLTSITAEPNGLLTKTPSYLQDFSYADGIVASENSGLGSLGTPEELSQYWKPSTDFNFSDAVFGVESPGTGGGWTFITAPEEISWDMANAANRVDIFGTNSPPVISGTRGMRDMRLGNALVEGFMRGKTVEAKVLALENLANYSLNTSKGFVNVPVFQVWANNKKYGNNGYFIIKDVAVKEVMRDLRGDATRAYVDVSLMQVPEFQVDSGRDQASVAVTGGKAAFPTPKPNSTQAGTTAGNQEVGTPAKPASAAAAPGSTAPAGSTTASVKPVDPAVDTQIKTRP
jgi:hypothetical protein